MVSQSNSAGYTIRGKTADLTVVQKTTIDTLHMEGKAQKVIAKEAGCSQSSVSKHINREAKGRKRCGRKKCTSNRDNRNLDRIVKQNPFKNVGEIHKEWTTKRTGLLLSGPKLCSLMRVNFAFPLEIRVPESGGRNERHRIHVA